MEFENTSSFISMALNSFILTWTTSQWMTICGCMMKLYKMKVKNKSWLKQKWEQAFTKDNIKSQRVVSNFLFCKTLMDHWLWDTGAWLFVKTLENSFMTLSCLDLPYLPSFSTCTQRKILPKKLYFAPILFNFSWCMLWNTKRGTSENVGTLYLCHLMGGKEPLTFEMHSCCHLTSLTFH